jgi:two-component system, chemotaxis family, response regulator Rcp1
MIRPAAIPAMKIGLKHASVVSPARVLVIEDNSSDVFLLERALHQQDLRFELIHLADGGEALAFIRRDGAYADAPIPHLILVDLNLSRYSGEDVLREIRDAKHLAGVPVCAWSSSQSHRDRARLMGLGVARFVTKPSGLDQFMEIGKLIKDLLAAHRTT